MPPRQDPEPPIPAWKKYLLPGAGAGALVLVVVLIAAIFAAGGGASDDDNDDENGDDSSVALDVDASETETAEAIPQVTATPTVDLTAESELVPLTPEAEPTEEITPEPTPEPTPEQETVAEEPAPTSTPIPEQQASEPEAPPPAGDFGELPPGDMPSGSPAEAMNLGYSLDMNMGAIPTQAPVYQIGQPQWSPGEVQDIASRLGIDAEIVDQGGGSFRAEGSSASIYISPASTQYVQPSSTSPAELPGNEQLVQMARSWLADSGMAGTGVGSGQVLDRDEGSGRATVSLKPAEPASIISATPSARVTLRGDGTVVEAHISWPASLSSSTYGLRSAENLWADASQGRGFVDISANDLPPNFQGNAGTVSITSVSIAYTIAGGTQGTQYLAPVAVFSGTASIDGASGAIPVSIYVQAAASQAVPRG